MPNEKQSSSFYGWNNLYGAVGGIAQIFGGVAVAPTYPIGGAALIGSGTSCLIYSATTHNDDMTVTGYASYAAAGAAIGAGLGAGTQYGAQYWVEHNATRVGSETVKFLLSSAPPGIAGGVGGLACGITGKLFTQNATPSQSSSTTPKPSV